MNELEVGVVLLLPLLLLGAQVNELKVGAVLLLPLLLLGTMAVN